MPFLRSPIGRWTVVWLGFIGVLWTMSSGEPVCEGPLILGVQQAFPPECGSPADTAVQFALVGLTIGYGVIGAASVFRAAFRDDGGPAQPE